MKTLSTAELIDWLPHRPPMVWVDEVGESSENGGECFVTLREDGLYFASHGLRETSPIEFLAQGFGYLAAATSVRSGKTEVPQKQKAFLVSVTQCTLHDLSTVRAGDQLTISVSGVKHVGPITLFNGKVATDSGTLLCEANLKVFSE
jgi:3-hydroxymyristoyl/3-hydroxydecanoyl-(acyl carrier protein) dehydratase